MCLQCSALHHARTHRVNSVNVWARRGKEHKGWEAEKDDFPLKLRQPVPIIACFTQTTRAYWTWRREVEGSEASGTRSHKPDTCQGRCKCSAAERWTWALWKSCYSHRLWGCRATENTKDRNRNKLVTRFQRMWKEWLWISLSSLTKYKILKHKTPDTHQATSEKHITFTSVWQGKFLLAVCIQTH